MPNTKEELKKVIALLKVEKEEDLEQYRKKVLNIGLDERKKEGVCWYPVIQRKNYIGTGEKLIIEVERTSGINQPHVFQSGKVVSLFSNTGQRADRHNNAPGVINFVKKDTMTITLNSDELPEWIDDGRLGVDLLFDEGSYREMETAMRKVLEAGKERVGELREIMLGNDLAKFTSKGKQVNPHLNESQNEALNNILRANDVAIIHGPPGTGKTTTLVQAVKETIKSENQVLVCAPSNAAVDLLAEKLSEEGVKVLRLGHPARVTESILEKTLDAQIANHDSFRDLKLVRRKEEEFRNIAFKYKRKYGHSEREQRKLLLRESSKMRTEADHLEHYIINDLFDKTEAVLCTLVGASNYLLKDKKFYTLFIDEAAQALEPACWIPILKAKRVIFAGDHCQLPPTIKSITAAKEGLQVTLFEKCIQRNEVDVMLKTQYRMHEEIMNFSSRQFYKGALEAFEGIKDHRLMEGEIPMEFIDTAGCGYHDQTDKETRSSYNHEEGNLLLNHLNGLVEKNRKGIYAPPQYQDRDYFSL